MSWKRHDDGSVSFLHVFVLERQLAVKLSATIVALHSIAFRVTARKCELGILRAIRCGNVQPTPHQRLILQDTNALLITPGQSLLPVRVAGIRCGPIGFEYLLPSFVAWFIANDDAGGK